VILEIIPKKIWIHQIFIQKNKFCSLAKIPTHHTQSNQTPFNSREVKKVQEWKTDKKLEWKDEFVQIWKEVKKEIWVNEKQEKWVEEKVPFTRHEKKKEWVSLIKKIHGWKPTI
jgi:hypothetical protein